MSNNLAQNPLIFDTEGATSAYTGKGFITAIFWKVAPVEGNLVSLRESASGRIIWQAIDPGWSVWLFPAVPIRFTDLYVDDLDGGTLFVYLA